MTAGQTDKATNATARHDLSDWLDLHALDAAQCRQILQDWPDSGPERRPQPRSEPGAQKAHSAPASELPTAQVVWDMARAALRAEFGGGADVIDATHARTQTLFQPDPQKYPRAFTLNDNGQGVPLVVCNYQGRVADIMTLAHEFGHAVQISASGGRFVPPVGREVCAFLSELAMLAYLKGQKSDLYDGARQVWQAATLKIWRKDRVELLAALGDLATPYNYQWNYPMAHIVAAQASARAWGKPATDPRVWLLFEGGLPAAELWRI